MKQLSSNEKNAIKVKHCDLKASINVIVKQNTLDKRNLTQFIDVILQTIFSADLNTNSLARAQNHSKSPQVLLIM